MTGPDLFDLWAPADSPWSPWAKPVLFAEPALPAGGPPPPGPALQAAPPASATWPAPPAAPIPPGPSGLTPAPASPNAPAPVLATPGGELAPLDLSSISALGASGSMAIVADLAGARSVEAGLQLAGQGFRPVPLFNGAPHPGALVGTQPLQQALRDGAETLRSAWPGAEAPPLFLLDARRQSPKGSAAPGSFDNRWLTFPQDFPSASFLQARRIRSVLLLQEAGSFQPQEDLAHVLRRWQEAGIEILLAHPVAGASAVPLQVEKPSRFRTLSYRALALFGLHRNSAGGFGSIIPMPAPGGGSGLGFG